VRFLTDENIPRDVVRMLRDLGHDVMDVREQGMGGAADDDVSEAAKSGDRILVTMDTDFANILQYPPHEYAGVIVLRVPRPTRHRIAEALKEFLAVVNEKDIEHSLVIVGPGAYRVRRGARGK